MKHSVVDITTSAVCSDQAKRPDFECTFSGTRFEKSIVIAH